jgi:hypothetical protein
MCIENAQKQWLKFNGFSTSKFITKGIGLSMDQSCYVSMCVHHASVVILPKTCVNLTLNINAQITSSIWDYMSSDYEETWF